ncbi:glycosyltransferase family 4 protein [uncultured Barnesiella sp.]|uniref:glycosyltransferase family 4 protein n=1 Tax=uncultured Barnesiella sp. TaxID=584861 RepID=UPI00260C3CB6|nr:glycosyltransferase family 4 protein [uncultured Barnesiella sp.]
MAVILFFASDFKIGLSALLTDELIAFYQYGIDILAIAGENEQEPGLTEKVKSENIPLIRIAGLDCHANFRVLVEKIKEIIVENNIHIVHVQNNWQLALVAYVKYKLLFKHKIRIVYTLHGFRHNSLWKSYIAQVIIGAALLLFADRVICMCSYLKRKFRLLSYKIELLPLGVPSSFFTEEFQQLPQNGLQMIFPAQFRHGKNQDVIIRAFAKHIKQTNDGDSRLILPGAGDLLNEMKRLADSLGISNRVEFPGLLSKEDIRQLYLKSNIGIVSSNSETFGQSIVEPFVLGRCVISRPVGIANDIIQNGVNGYIYNHEKELTEIFDDLYAHQELICQIGENNFRERDLFNWKRISRVYKEKIYLLVEKYENPSGT